jgi:DNA-binding NarL/FixJ family response regulator
MKSDQDEMIKVAIVEDHDAYREVISDIIANAEGLEMIGAYPAIEEVTDDILQADVILMDIGLPGRSGIEGLKEIKHHDPGIHIIMLTNYIDDDKIFEALAAGADGYLLKKVSTTRILEAINDTYRGGASITPLIARRVLQTFKIPLDTEKKHETLTPREVEILALLVQGLNYKTAADELFISPETVRNHIRNIYKKLQVRSRSEAVVMAIRQGLV